MISNSKFVKFSRFEELFRGLGSEEPSGEGRNALLGHSEVFGAVEGVGSIHEEFHRFEKDDAGRKERREGERASEDFWVGKKWKY